MRVVCADDPSAGSAQSAVCRNVVARIDPVAGRRGQYVARGDRLFDELGRPYQQPAAFVRRFTARVIADG
jgi:hypothetical protein